MIKDSKFSLCQKLPLFVLGHLSDQESSQVQTQLQKFAGIQEQVVELESSICELREVASLPLPALMLQSSWRSRLYSWWEHLWFYKKSYFVLGSLLFLSTLVGFFWS